MSKITRVEMELIKNKNDETISELAEMEYDFEYIINKCSYAGVGITFVGGFFDKDLGNDIFHFSYMSVVGDKSDEFTSDIVGCRSIIADICSDATFRCIQNGLYNHEVSQNGVEAIDISRLENHKSAIDTRE